MKRQIQVFFALMLAIPLATPLACTTTTTDVKPVDTGSVKVRLLRVDPTEGSETHMTGQFVVRVENASAKAVHIKRIALEVNFSDDLQPADLTAPAAGTQAASDNAASDESAAQAGEPGSGGDAQDEVDVYEGELSPGHSIAAGEREDFVVPIRLDYPEDPALYVAFCRMGIAHLDIDALIDTSNGPYKVSDNLEIPTPSLPEPKAEEVQIATSNGGQNGDMGMLLRIYNPNVFPYKIRDWRYKIYVAGKMMREGEVGTGERILGNTAVQYDVAIPLNTETYGPGIVDVLRSQSVPYRIVGEMRFLDVKLPVVIDSKVDFSR